MLILHLVFLTSLTIVLAFNMMSADYNIAVSIIACMSPWTESSLEESVDFQITHYRGFNAIYTI